MHNSKEFTSNRSSESLIFQFLLNEALIVQKMVSEPPTEKIFKELLGALPSFDWRSISIWGVSRPGHLHKLHYYHSLIVNGNEERSDPQNLENTLNHLLMLTKECQISFIQNRITPHALLEEKTKEFLSLLLERAVTYRDNAPFIFFLLRKSSAIDAIYEEGSLANLLLSLFEGGFNEVSRFLVDYYSQKGFAHLLSPIQESINLLKPCLI